MNGIIEVSNGPGSRLAETLPALPGVKVEITIRAATMADLPFIDALQKANKKGLGF